MNTGIDRIGIEGFKSIKHATIQLNSLNILIGANGAGKSNFIELFKLLNSLFERRLQQYVGIAGGANNLLHFGRKHTPSMIVEINFDVSSRRYAFQLTSTDENAFIFEHESLNHKDSKRKKSFVEYTHPEVLLNQVAKLNTPDTFDKGFDQYVTTLIQGIRIYHFQDTSREARVKQSCELHDNRELKTDAANLAAFLYLLKTKHNNEYKCIVETVRLAAPYFDDFLLEPLALNTEMIRLEWREKGSEHVFGPSALSDGTLRFICLATALLQPNLPSTLLIDEPELGLHPYAITLLAELIREASLKTQVIVSTQSVTLVNQFEPTDIIVVDRENGQSVFKRLDEAQMATWLEDYGLGDLWEKNLLGGRP